MPTLTAEERDKLPRSAFGMPSQRKYPILVPGREKAFADSALRLRGMGKGMDAADRSRIIRMASKVLYVKGVSTDEALKKLRAGKKGSSHSSHGEKSPSQIKNRMMKKGY